ncbi:ROK family protein [Enterobacter hormaechei]
MSEQGEQLFRHRLPTPRDDYHQTIETIARLVDMAEQATGETGTVGWGSLALFPAVYRRGENANSTCCLRSAV